MSTTNPFRRRGTVVVQIADLDWVDEEYLEVRYPFPSMLMTEAYEWERRSGMKQSQFWKAVGSGDLIGLQMLLWQALRRQDGDDPRSDPVQPWSMLRWEDLPEVDLFRLSYDIEGIDSEEFAGEVDDDVPTTSSEEGSTSDSTE